MRKSGNLSLIVFAYGNYAEFNEKQQWFSVHKF